MKKHVTQICLLRTLMTTSFPCLQASSFKSRTTLLLCPINILNFLPVVRQIWELISDLLAWLSQEETLSLLQTSASQHLASCEAGKWTCFGNIGKFSSVQFSRSVVSDSSWPHGLLHARPPCPLLTPGAYSNSCPLRWWCHPTISPSAIPFSSCLQFFSASGSYQISQYFTSGGQNIGISALASVLPMNIQD